MNRISVIVPTFRRHSDLERCLSAISLQKRPPDEVLVIARPEDLPAQQVAKKWTSLIPVRLIPVQAGGVVNALNAGLASCQGDIICITDDDAAPRPSWTERIEHHFSSDQKIGGVGGRDWVHHDDIEYPAKEVGTVKWWGKIHGNHHLGFGEPRFVDTLKGANMSFRASAIAGLRFDVRLRGSGAQVHNEMAFCFQVLSRGWRLLYDPEVCVDHYPSVRHDNDQRATFNASAAFDSSFNLYLTLQESTTLGVRRTMAILLVKLVGSRYEPGSIRAILLALQGDHCALTRWRCAREGRSAARDQLRAAKRSQTERQYTPPAIGAKNVN